MTTVLVSGAAGTVGHRVCRRLSTNAGIDRVVAVDHAVPPLGSFGTGDESRVVWHRADLSVMDIDAVMEGVDVVVHLAACAEPGSDAQVSATDDVEMAELTLAAVERCAVGHVVLRSTAMVYGAWQDNPIPLQENDPVRANPELPYASGRAEIERVVKRWAERNGTTATILRPTVTVAEEPSGWAAQSLRALLLLRATDSDPPRQFLHADDLADAIVLSVLERLDGVFNVAPDGWLDGAVVRTLVGPLPSVPLPNIALRPVVGAFRRFWLTPASPGMVPFIVHSWVVSNDRLRSAGWVPGNANDEAFVAGHDALLSDLSPQRRQEVLLGVVGLAALAIVAGASTWARRLLTR